MIFQQSSAPTGWTKDTTDVNQRAMRVVSGNVSSGGNQDFTDTFRNWTTNNHTLTTAQLASHRHKVDTNNEWNESHGNWQTETGQWRQVHAGGTNYKPWTSYEGSGNSHNHGTMNFAVRYLDVIICSKDSA